MKVYLSSTYEDLVKHRDRAYKALRRLGFDVVAMEDYVAADKRPVQQCLADVEAADLYIGLFAFRYGYVPGDDNPDGRSITEMEYRHAVTCDKPRLIFTVPEDGEWRTNFIDGHTGAGDRGTAIRSLRDELGRERLVSTFTTPEQLSEAVTTAAAKWLVQKEGAVPPTTVTVTPSGVPHPRQLRFDLLLLHIQTDSAAAAGLEEALRPLWRVHTSATGLVAASADELRDLDRIVASARAVAMLLSPSSLTVLAEDPARTRRILRLARDRAAGLIGVAITQVVPDKAWGLTELVGPVGQGGDDVANVAMRLHNALAERVERVEVPEIGLPVVVVAMTASEAADLVAEPPDAVAPLLELVGGTAELSDRYGQTRSQWKPFMYSVETIQQVLDTAATAANRDMALTQGRRIRLQPYPLDPLLDDPLKTWLLYEDIARTGCLVVADELSMFHRQVREAFVRSPLHQGPQVALVTLSPLDPSAGAPYAVMREQLDGFLKDAARRFEEVLDPLCELNVPERRRLVRWLYGSLPRAVDVDAQRDPGKLGDFAKELGRRPNLMMARLIGGERGST